MTNHLLWLAIAYIVHSSYLTGKFFQEENMSPSDCWKGILGYSLALLLFTILAPFFYWPPIIWELMKKGWTLFQCQFFFYFWFTSKYDNCTQEQLYGFNDVARRYHQKDTFRDQVWRYAVECLNTRFAYTYVQKKESDEDTETQEDE